MFDTLSLALLAPLPPLAVAALALATPGRRPGRLPRVAEGGALAALALALAGTGQVAFGAAQDPVGATLAALVAFVGWAVVRYARSYMDGEAREGAFHARLLFTLAAVLVLVQAGNLWLLAAALAAAGVGLNTLLAFYPERAGARRAAARHARVWGLAVALVVAGTAGLQAVAGTASLAALGPAVAGPDGLAPLAMLSVGAMVVAAALLCAAFPLQGWLTGVMEAPTPVSALLHAGIVNAGGVLMIRLAEVVQASPGAMAALVMIGGLTAILGAAVMLAQAAVKTALAWSTVAQMGFLLLQCGLGLWALALLHIVAHSLYKAHAFLSSGGAVALVRAERRAGPVAVPDGRAVGRSFALALALYAAMAAAVTLIGGPKAPQALALGAILIFGVAYLVAQGLAGAAPRALAQRTGLAAVAATAGYFAFHLIAQALWGAHLPAPPAAGALEWALIVLAVASFGLVAVAQALFPLWAHHPAAEGLRVHLANGLYLDRLADRWLGPAPSAPRA
jgi:NAD(P)H-quinone oxidoreductase subunit 5